MKKYIKLQLVAVTTLVSSLIMVAPAGAAGDAGVKPKDAMTAPAGPTTADKPKTEPSKTPVKPKPTAEPKAPEKDATKTEKSAPATKPPASASELTKLAREILKAARAGDWGFVMLLSLLLVVGGVRIAVDRWDMAKFKLGWMEWFATRWGGWTLVTAGSVVAALITAKAAGINLTFWTSLELIGVAVFMALGATGAHVFVKDVKDSKKPAPSVE
jgi:hypothetical protein